MRTNRCKSLAALIGGAMTLASCGFGALDSPESVSIEVMPAAYLSSHSLLTLHETDVGPVLTSMSPDEEICRWILDNGDTTCAPAQLGGIDASSGLTADANVAWHIDFGSARVSLTDFTKSASETFKSEFSAFDVMPDGTAFLGTRSDGSLVLADSSTKKAQRSVPGLPRYGRNEIDSEGNIWSTDQDSVWFSSVDQTNTRRIDLPLDDLDYTIAGTNAKTELAILAANPIYRTEQFWVVDIVGATLIPSPETLWDSDATVVGGGIAPDGNFVISLWEVGDGIGGGDLQVFAADLNVKDGSMGPLRLLTDLSLQGITANSFNYFRVSDDGQFSILGEDADGLPIIVVATLS